MERTVAIEDPRTADVAAVLLAHLEFCQQTTPAEGVFALDADSLRKLGITLFVVREAGKPIGVCALKLLDETHAELKSMHTLQTDRHTGVGTLLVSHVLEFARSSSLSRISLETGASEHFLPARELYARLGFTECQAFSNYAAVPTSAFMSIEL